MKIVKIYVNDVEPTLELLNRRLRSHMFMGLIFGIAVELSLAAHQRKLMELNEKIDRLDRDIRELRSGEGE